MPIDDKRPLSDRLPYNQAPEIAEHSKFERSKRVVDGPLIPAAHASEARTIDPIDLTNQSTQLARNKRYRIIGSAAFNFRLSSGASTAAATDIYVPADTPVIIEMHHYDYINVAGGTNVQALELR